MREIIDLWNSQPTSEKWAGVAFAVFFPLFILAFALVTP